MPTNNYLDISEVIETFDPDEMRALIQKQLELLNDDACEIMVDNFKIIFKRYASLKEDRDQFEPETFSEAEDRFFNICQIFIEEISKRFDFIIDDDFLDKNYGTLPGITLPIYLFFVLDFRSNITSALLTFIMKNKEAIAEHFDEMRSKHDSITIVNRSIEDQNVALITSAIYDVIDWCFEHMTTEDMFDSMEKEYIALAPIKTMYEDSVLNGELIDSIGDVVTTNILLKARIGYDIICRLRGFDLTV